MMLLGLSEVTAGLGNSESERKIYFTEVISTEGCKGNDVLIVLSSGIQRPRASILSPLGVPMPCQEL